MGEKPLQPFNIFYSYAHKDEKLRDELGKHLYPLKRQGLIVDWFDRNISAGKEWEREITTHLNTAHLILLLISPDFIASDYCYGIEMQRALERHETKEARVIPILLKPVDWQGTSFSKLQMLPKNAKAVTKWSNQQDALAEIAKNIRETLKEIPSSLSSAPASLSALSEEVISLPSIQFSSPVTTLPPALTSEQEPPPVWYVPYRRNSFFTGREALLDRLHRAFTIPEASSSPHVCLLSGLGGAGKTQLAIEYAHHYRESYQTVLWAKADSLEVLSSEFTHFATLLNLPGTHEQEQKYTFDVFKRWLETASNWLLVLDNVADLNALFSFLPPMPKGHIILTSQIQVTSGVAFGLFVGPMTREEGSIFLLQKTGHLPPGAFLDTVPEATQQAAAAIVEAMGGLPLAIDQAGAYIDETGCGLARYLALYKERKSYLLKNRGEFAPDHPESVAATLALSITMIEQANVHALELLRLCAFLHPDTIFEELILKGASLFGPSFQMVASDIIRLNETIGTLHKYSLIRRNPEGTLTIHRLVQVILREMIGQESQSLWAERTVKAVNHAFPEVDIQSWQECLRYLPHAQACSFLIQQENMRFSEAAHLLSKAGYYLYEQGQYQEGEPLLTQAMHIYEQISKPDDLDMARNLNRLAELYREQGKYAQAEPLYQRAIALYEQYAPDSLALATSLNDLGKLYSAQAKYEQEESLHQRALEIRRSLLGNEHSEVATSLSNLARLYQEQGQYPLALPLFQQAFTIKEKTVGPEHPDTASSLNNLAALYQEQGQYEQAFPLQQRALAICEKVLGPEHPATANSLNNLAVFYVHQKLYRLAEPFFQRALSIYQQVLGPTHPRTINIVKNYSMLLRRTNRKEQAVSLEKRTRAAKRKETEVKSNSIYQFLEEA